MSERTVLNMIYKTSMDATRTISFPNPHPTLTTAHINLANSRIMAIQPFDESVGSLEGLLRAERVNVNRNILFNDSANA